MDRSKGKKRINKDVENGWLMRRALMTAARQLGLSWSAIGFIFNMERNNVRRMILDHIKREHLK